MDNIDLNKCEYFYEQEGLKLCKDNLSGSCHPNCNIYQILKELKQTEQKLERIKEMIKFNMKVSCGADCTKNNCNCRNKEILDIIEGKILGKI